MDARYRDANGKPQFVHTLNGSGVAVGRGADRGDGKLPERRRVGDDSRGAASLYGRDRKDRRMKANPRILLTNDDGVDAPGLAVLLGIAKALSDDVWVVAPANTRAAPGIG